MFELSSEESWTLMNEKVKSVEAKKVVFAPAEKGMLLQAQGEQLKCLFLGHVVMEGGTIVHKGRRQRFCHRPTTEEEKRMDEMLHDFWENMRFLVVETNPKGAVKITNATEVKVLSSHPDCARETQRSNVLMLLGDLWKRHSDFSYNQLTQYMLDKGVLPADFFISDKPITDEELENNLTYQIREEMKQMKK